MGKYLVIFILLFMLACSDDSDCGLPGLESKASCDAPSTTQGLTANELMDLYVVDEELTVEKMGDLWYVIMEPGGEDKPRANSRVTVDYSGFYRNNCSFDKGKSISFGLTNLIEGWKVGIPLVGKCGSIKLIVPPKLAYGSNPKNGIKKGEPLIFDINVLDF